MSNDTDFDFLPDGIKMEAEQSKTTGLLPEQVPTRNPTKTGCNICNAPLKQVFY